MTRKQIRNKIRDTIADSITVHDDIGLWGWEEAADEIMKLWDQGFIYEIPIDNLGKP